MENRKFKSSDRIKNFGEVFTPKKTVDFMLDQPEIKKKVNSLTATFLEPSAGQGAFLVEILNRKLKVAIKTSKNLAELNDNFLLALSTLYGIELLEDNVEMLVMNMSEEFHKDYLGAVTKLSEKPNKKVFQSAETIISANMVQGDTLTRKNNTGDPIIFSEWKELPIKNKTRKVQRTEHTFASIIEGAEADEKEDNRVEQLDLFGNLESKQDVNKSRRKQYLPVRWEDIYRQLVK